MEKRVKKFIIDGKFNIDNKIVCATSGGADSLAMLYILHNLGYECILAHVNHHKRIESEMEEKEMKDLALKLNIPFEVLEYHFDGNGNFHDQSHIARYNFFKEVCDKYHTNIISTAHHSDDLIETVLIKLLEGSNLYGYGGIKSCYFDGKYKIIRPLISFSKEELKDYCVKNNIKYFDDKSNFEDDYLRNRLRHHVIPLLKDECHDLGAKTLKYSNILYESFDFIRKLSINYLNEHNDTINIDDFESLDIALKKDIISLMLEKYNIRKNTNVLTDILDLIKDKSGNKNIDLSDGFILNKSYNLVSIIKKEKLESEIISLNLDEVKTFNGMFKFYFSKNIPTNNAKYIKLCYNNLKLPFYIRCKMEGDKINIQNGTKKISRVFIDKKIPEAIRNVTPIILDNSNNIIWVYDLIKSDDIYKMKENCDIYLVGEVL